METRLITQNVSHVEVKLPACVTFKTLIENVFMLSCSKNFFPLYLLTVAAALCLENPFYSTSV